MKKKKAKQRRQQLRQQHRAAKTVERRKDGGKHGPKLASPYAVQFDQLEAEAIAGMMVSGADEFAERYGAILQASQLLIEEEEFSDLRIDDATTAAAIAPLAAATAAAEEREEELAEEELLAHLGAMLRHVMQDDAFRADLLSRLDQFIGRARNEPALRRKWLSAVAVKFLLEQPPAQLSTQALQSCSLLVFLVEEAWEHYEESQFLAGSLMEEATVSRQDNLGGTQLDDDFDDDIS